MIVLRKFIRILILIFLIAGLVFNTTMMFSAANEVEGVEETPALLIPGGDTIGMKIYTKGVYIIGITYVETNEGRKYPGRDAELKIGDYITEINGKRILSAEDFSKAITAGREVNAVINRNGQLINITLLPALQKNSNEYKMGLWVRDSTAGIGTVTFYNKNNNTFGALGHGICDADTGKLLNIEKGYSYEAFINSVKKGEKGTPGELTANFQYLSRADGYIKLNTPYGVFGSVNIVPDGDEIPVATANEVELGEAEIISTVNGEEKQKYKVEIVRLNTGKSLFGTGMIIKVTDNDLIRKTGGIVQGMSGSPIIQNGKLVGAVTHVLVNDPTRGYGIFIENMLAEAEKIK